MCICSIYIFKYGFFLRFLEFIVLLVAYFLNLLQIKYNLDFIMCICSIYIFKYEFCLRFLEFKVFFIAYFLNLLHIKYNLDFIMCIYSIYIFKYEFCLRFFEFKVILIAYYLMLSIILLCRNTYKIIFMREKLCLYAVLLKYTFQYRP